MSKERIYPLDAKDTFWLVITWASLLIIVLVLAL